MSSIHYVCVCVCVYVCENDGDSEHGTSYLTLSFVSSMNWIRRLKQGVIAAKVN